MPDSLDSAPDPASRPAKVVAASRGGNVQSTRTLFVDVHVLKR